MMDGDQWDLEAWDDVSGKALDPEKVREARKEELGYFHRYEVYEKVPTRECWERTGKAPIGVRWIDINKGDAENPAYRSRLVATEIKRDQREDLFAATPPLEALNTAGIHGHDRGNWVREREGGTGNETGSH